MAFDAFDRRGVNRQGQGEQGDESHRDCGQQRRNVEAFIPQCNCLDSPLHLSLRDRVGRTNAVPVRRLKR
jgi:hypothetical protein